MFSIEGNFYDLIQWMLRAIPLSKRIPLESMHLDTEDLLRFPNKIQDSLWWVEVGIFQ